jgi:hypothetical protein
MKGLGRHLAVSKGRAGLAAIVGVILVGGLTSRVLGRDARLDQCGVAEYTSVSASFDLPRAKDFFARFPAVGSETIPELDVEVSAFVAVYQGPLKISGMQATPIEGTGASKEPDHVNAVCVLIDGTINLYPDLDITGFRP